MALRRQLSALSSWHLVNIITGHRLSDEDPVALSARPRASLVDLIIETLRREHGSATR